MRYDFIIAPNGNPKDIVLNFKGTNGVSINANGELVLRTAIGDVVQQKLYAYQIIDNVKKQVQCSFVMSHGKVGFQLEKYDHTKAITIDPLIYSSYFGGNEIDQGRKVVLDSDGNVIVVGNTRGGIFPVQAGSYSRNYSGEWEGYVAKFNPTLSDLVFCTYFGGNGVDWVTSCAVDGGDNIVFCGLTSSSDLPNNTTEFDRTYNGETDAFVAKLTSTGTNLIYGTYLGGTKIDVANDIVNVPLTDDAIIVGRTASTNFPIKGGYRTVNKNFGNGFALDDGFVTKINKLGTALVFSTYIGVDSALDECYGVALDKDNYPIVVGTTVNGEFTLNKVYPKNSFPTTSSAVRKVNSNIKTSDGFLIKLGKNGNTLDYSTLIGGDSSDICYGVDVDKQGNAVVCGTTWSKTGFNPTGYDQTFEGITEGFAVRMGTSGGLLFSTFLGGSGDDEAKSIKYLGTTGSIIVGGSVTSGDFPVGSVKEFNYSALSDGFIVQLSFEGKTCQYLSYIGGTSEDQVSSLTISKNKDVYFTGNTLSSDIPTTSNAKFRQFNGSQDAFVMALNTCFIKTEPPKDTVVCAGKPLTLINNATGNGNLLYNWVDLNIGGATSTSPILTFTPEEAHYYYELTVTDDNCSKTVLYNITTIPAPIINSTDTKRVCTGTSLTLSATTGPFSTIAWYDSLQVITPIGKGATYTTKPLTASTTLYVESTDTSTKCTSGRKPIRIIVVPPPTAPFLDNASLCANNSATLKAIFPSDVDFRWYDSLTGGKLLQVGRNFTTPILATTTVYYIESLDTTTNCISAKRTPVTVTILPSPNPIIQGQNAACVNSSGLVYTVASNPKRQYTWTITPNGTITNGLGTNQITVNWNALGAGVISLTEKDLGSNCTKDVTYPVNISNELALTLAETGNQDFCTGDSIILDAGAGYTSYKWSNGETSPMITVKTAGEYSVAVQDASGCKGNSNKVTVTVSPRPNPSIVGQNSTCVNGNPIQYSVTPVAINSYTWVVSTEGTIATGQGSSSITVNWTTAGVGSVKVIESSNKCTTENTMAITVTNSLSPTIKPLGKTTLCEGESVVLDADNFASYKWSSGETSRTITVTKAGSYTVEVTDAGGCKGTSQPIVVSVSPLPTPTIIAAGKTQLCEGESVELDAGVLANATYLWSNGATTQKIIAKTAGKYSVTVTNASGCKGTSADITITVNPLPALPTITQKGDDSLVISPFDAANSYAWKLDGTDISQSSQSILAANEGKYTVEVTNANGCKSISLPFQYLKPSSAVLTVAVSPTLIEAAAGETVNVPLVITSSKNLTPATASNFIAELSVEPSLLTQSSGTSTIDIQNRRIISVSGTRKDGNDTLAIVELKAGLGAVETSTIVVKSLTFTSGKAQVTTKDGEFHLKGICRDGGVRLFKASAPLSLSVQPNPASDVLSMTLTTAEEGLHKILLTNILGQNVMELFNGQINGTQLLTNSISDIPSGVYFLIVQSPSQSLVKRVLVE
jgi:hypothetical protein